MTTQKIDVGDSCWSQNMLVKIVTNMLALSLTSPRDDGILKKYFRYFGMSYVTHQKNMTVM